MILTLVIIFFILGLIIGSFLNVVICRMNTERSLGGRSACMSCQHKLCWYDLIPVFSFLFLYGRCRKCQTRISYQYILVEFFTGLIFASLFLKLVNLAGRQVFFDSTFAITYSYYAVMFSILMIIVVYDLRHKIIPDSFSLFFGILAFIGLFFFHTLSVWEFLSGILLASPFYLFWLLSHGRWMGLGDAKLVLGLGWFLGLSLGFSAIVLAFWIGSIVGLTLVIFSKIKNHHRYGMKSEIPFAPYLVLGTLLVFFFNLNLFTL
ncbi:MAG: prepilin peptidase [Candidatus Parcubacteria bacterium]|nr:prepilin peptidase [Candidatus Parcubacteria bacterium]